eukprot:m.179234 g.179234  ORF g.179234 m.179234 type:complete len:201 (-) comp15474_c0_seq6:336-938(-)
MMYLGSILRRYWSLITACEAGIATVLLTNPLWELNTKEVLVTTGDDKGKTPSTLKALYELWRKGEIASLYTGVVPSLILVTGVPFIAYILMYVVVKVSAPMTQFYFYELLLRISSSMISKNKKVVSAVLSPSANFILGALSKALSTLVTYPIQTIRTCLQTLDDTEGPTQRQNRNNNLIIQRLQHTSLPEYLKLSSKTDF